MEQGIFSGRFLTQSNIFFDPVKHFLIFLHDARRVFLCAYHGKQGSDVVFVEKAARLCISGEFGHQLGLFFIINMNKTRQLRVG